MLSHSDPHSMDPITRQVDRDRQGVEMREVDAAMPVPLLTYTQAQSGQYDYAATPAAAVAAPASRRGSALARTGLPCGARSRPTSRLSVELDTIESDKDKDAEADGSSKALPLADAHGKNSVSASDKIQILDVDASESNHSILDTIRAQRRRTRKLAITIAAVVFCLLLLTGAIYGAVVDATWKKYQSKNPMKGDIIIACLLCLGLALIYEMSSNPSTKSSSDDNSDFVRLNDGRSINATALAGVKRIWAHSHNDEMQAVPLATALSQGFGSIEIDVWLSNPSTTPAILSGDMWIGHESKDLPRSHDSSTPTLNSVYLTPLLELLDQNNAAVPARTASGNASWVGVYPSDPTQTVQLVFDAKGDPMQTYLQLQKALAPFKAKGYLTTYDMAAGKWQEGPLTVIGTGNMPIEAIYYAARASNSSSSSNNSTDSLEKSTERYIFYDAPLLSLSKPFSIPASPLGPVVSDIPWTADISPMASAKFPVPFNAAAFLPPPPANIVMPHLRWYADQAAAKGIRARWWGAARNPGWVRRRLWTLILDGGNGWLGADDLIDARKAIAAFSG